MPSWQLVLAVVLALAVAAAAFQVAKGTQAETDEERAEMQQW